MSQDLRALLANITENETKPVEEDSKNFHSRVLLIDGLNYSSETLQQLIL